MTSSRHYRHMILIALGTISLMFSIHLIFNYYSIKHFSSQNSIQTESALNLTKKE